MIGIHPIVLFCSSFYVNLCQRETVETLALILIDFSQLVKQWLVNSQQFNVILFFI